MSQWKLTGSSQQCESAVCVTVCLTTLSLHRHYCPCTDMVSNTPWNLQSLLEIVWLCLSLMWPTVLVFRRCLTFVYWVTSGEHLTVHQDRYDVWVSSPAWLMSAMKSIFPDVKTLQFLADCGRNISRKSTVSHIWWSVRHRRWLLTTFLLQRSFPGMFYELFCVFFLSFWHCSGPQGSIWYVGQTD